MSKRLGVIGFGRMGYRTVLAGRDAGLDVTAVLDTVDTPWGISQDASWSDVLCTDLSAFLETLPDIVAIATTADSHAPLFHELADAGVTTMLVEKPVACSVLEAREMAARAKAENLQVRVNHNHRAWPVLQDIRALDSDPRFGSLVSFVITQGAGGLGNLGTHYFDLANWMFQADPIRVMGIGTTPETPNPRGPQFLDTGGAVLVEYPDQRRLLLEIGDDSGVVGGYEFRFERGRVIMPLVNEPPQVYFRADAARGLPKHIYGAPLQTYDWGVFQQADVVRNTALVLSDLIEGDQRHGATLEEATTALATSIGARIAIEDRQIVPLPLSETHAARRYALA